MCRSGFGLGAVVGSDEGPARHCGPPVAPGGGVSMGKCYVTFESEFFCDHVLPFLLHHGPEPWTRQNHWVFGHCGQSCGCCRSHNLEDAGPDANCELCYHGWIVTCVSRGWKASAQACARKYSRQNALCKCGTCPDEWLERGWVCPNVLCGFVWHLPRSMA